MNNLDASVIVCHLGENNKKNCLFACAYVRLMCLCECLNVWVKAMHMCVPSLYKIGPTQS